MANRQKEDEKNERIIRNLLKIPENRRCINCNSLGPQYVCTNFSTFVCTTCGGIHREFTHRVKSVSMAKFTPQEVSALQGGGNASAREIYLKEWDPQRNSLPDGSNVERLRDFIKHVYVDRRYTGERILEKPPRAKMAETDDFNGNRRTDAHQGGSRSPPYDDSFERRHSDRPSPGGRSPGYDEGNRQNSNYMRSPARAEVVNDWRREDRFGNGRRTEGRSSDGGSRLEGGSPDNQRDLDMSSPPMVRPVRDILGDNASPLRVIEPPKATGGKSTDGSAHTQRTASSSSRASPDVNPTEVKAEPSFIDFDSAPEPPAAVSVGEQVSTDASSAQVTASASNDWANFDSVPQRTASSSSMASPAVNPTEVKAYTTSSNSVESVLSELSIPTSMSGSAAPVGNFPTSQSSGSQGLSFDLSFGSTAPTSVHPPGGGPTVSLGRPPPPQLANAPTLTGGQWPSVNRQQHSLVQGGIGQSVSQVITPVIGGSLSNTVPNPLMPNFQRPPTGQADASVAKVGEAEKKSAIEAKSRGREALPEALFTMNYSYTHPVSGWYSGSPYVAGFPMQYNMPMAVSNFQVVPRSTNPFDVGNEPSPIQASSFPSVAALQEALPKTATPSGLLHTSSLGTPPPHPPSVLTQVPSYASAIPPSSFMGQDVARGMVPRPLGPSGYSSLETPVFAAVNPNPQLSGLHPAHSTTNNFSSASGNPFG